MSEKRLAYISIANDPSHELAIRLLVLWRPNLSSGGPVQANLPISGGDTGDPPEPPKPPWTALSKYDPPPKTKPPRSIMFHDGDVQAVKYWLDVYALTAAKLYAAGVIRASHTPIKWSPGTYSIHTEPVHRSGKKFHNYFEIGNPPLFVNTNLNPGQVRANTRALLRKYDIDPGSVHLEVG